MKHRNPEMGEEPWSYISLKLEEKIVEMIKISVFQRFNWSVGEVVRQGLGELTWPKLAEAVGAVERNVVLVNTVKASEVTSH